VTIQFRDYQLRAIHDARVKIGAGVRRIVLNAPTGAGKTCIAAGIVQSAIAKGKRVLFLAHRRELIEQTVNKLVDAGVLHFGVIMAGNRLNSADAPVQVASIQTLIRRELPPADLIIIDEAHRASARSYLSVIANYPSAAVLGLTATPERTDGKGLDDIFQDMIVVETVPNLIEQGFLVKPVCYVGPTADLSGVRTKRGDYDERQLATVMDKPKLVGDIIENWKRLARGKPTAVFAVNVAHADHIAAEFRAAGVSAAIS
jgi:superfamily II DNA or RNA helicase